MGARIFRVDAQGKTAYDAFRKAVDHARYMYGHGGYTGTITEKSEFTVIRVPDGEDPLAFADRLINEDDARIFAKWGPAGCVDRGGGHWHFFGWASS